MSYSIVVICTCGFANILREALTCLLQARAAWVKEVSSWSWQQMKSLDIELDGRTVLLESIIA